MLTRLDTDANYRSIFINGKTLRFAIDASKEITELRFPEFYDVSLGDKCKTGQTHVKQPDGSWKNCDYCYAAASLHGQYFDNVVEKIKWFFGNTPLKDRCYQWAIGGSSEPLEHKDFWKVCEAGRELQIVPNYTTNGVLVNDRVAGMTKDVCGGVAVTFHNHLEVFWRKAVKIFARNGVKLNAHIVISDKESIDKFAAQYQEFKDIIEYFVLLPYMNVGHAKNNPKIIDLENLERVVDPIYKEGKLAFGANFYPWLKKNRAKYGIDLYSPEIFSKYLMLSGTTPTVYNNSFEKIEVPFSHETGCQLGMVRSFEQSIAA